MKILITGGNGYIGRSLYKHYKEKYKTYEIVSVNRSIFDLTNRNSTDEFFSYTYFDVVIHCAIEGGSRLKSEDEKTAYNNIIMLHNLIQNKNHFSKLINIGSGAEIYSPTTPYGFSKKVINKIVQETKDFYTLRVFGLFDENELNTRYIKSCVEKCIGKNFIEINQNKYMDFFYMKDFIKMLDHYINTEFPKKEIDCVYECKYTLLEIAQLVKKIGNFDSGILFGEKGMGLPYIGKYEDIGLDFYGLQNGIKNVIEKLKCNQ